MGITIRRAVPDDIGWILGELEKFAKLYGTKKLLYGDEAYCREGLIRTMEGHLFLLAVRENVPLGFIAGFYSAHPYNPAIRLLTEFFWWVTKEARHTRAGFLLLDEYIRWGKENADWITFGITEETPIREETLTRRGFKPHERSYLMQVENKEALCQPPSR